MSIDPKFGRYCDECGRAITNAVRIHQGKDYCRACYQRTFVRVACSSCGGPMRAHKNAVAPPVCDPCVRSRRTCLRCGKLVLVAGRLVGKSAVCPACAPRFAEKRPCPQCGRLSARLSRPLFAGGDEAVCDSCRNRITHATCSVCRRYRPIAFTDEHGSRHCADCLPGSELTHACPGCGEVVKGGGLGHCRACLNRATIARDAALVASELDAPWCQELWQAFVDDALQAKEDQPRLRGELAQAADFFRALSRTFASAEAISARTLAARFDSGFLRAHLAASRFVIRQLGLADFEEARAVHVEAQRLANILSRSSGRPYEALLGGYAQWLDAAGVATRTARLYLRAAESFCEAVRLNGSAAWKPAALINHLKRSPGQAASLGRFVTYCRDALGWEVSLPAKSLWQGGRTRAARDVGALRTVLKDLDGRGDATLTTKELARVLSLALGLPAAALLRARTAQRMERRDDGAIVLGDDAVIDMAHPLYRFAQQWAHRSDVYRRRASE